VKSAQAEAGLMDAALKDYTAKTKLRPAVELRIARDELDGQIAAAAGHYRAGMKKLQAASQQERAMTYSEPPYYPRPVAESMGALALRHGKLGQAESAFRDALVQYPASARAQSGLRDALHRANKTSEAGL
jgi:uncharacterized protein HemY